MSRGGRNVLVVRSDIKKVFFKNYGRETHVPINKISNKHFLMYKKKDFECRLGREYRTVLLLRQTLMVSHATDGLATIPWRQPSSR